MRQSIGGSWLIGIMVLFIMIFAGYIILTIDYNKSVRVKNEAISLIEKYEGLNEQSITLLNNYLLGSSYTTTGKCGGQATTQGGMYGALDLEKSELEETDDDQNYYYCIKKYKGANTSYYYQITLFYRFNLPVLGDTSRFTIKGSTANFQAKDDIKYAKAIGGSSGGTVDNGNDDGPKSYTVKFRTNATNVIVPNQTVAAGEKATKPIDPERKGYIFNGWKLNGNDYDFNTPVTSSIVLIADWTKKDSPKPNVKEYTIVFDFNGGKYSAFGWGRLEDIEKENKIKNFDGLWGSVTNSGCSLDYFIDQDGNKYYRSNASFKVTKNMTLKAMWSGSCSYDPTPPTPSIKDYIVSRATDEWSGYYVCSSSYCEKVTLGAMKQAVCSDYMSKYSGKYSNVNACYSEVESIYNSLPERINK